MRKSTRYFKERRKWIKFFSHRWRPGTLRVPTTTKLSQYFTVGRHCSIKKSMSFDLDVDPLLFSQTKLNSLCDNYDGITSVFCSEPPLKHWEVFIRIDSTLVGIENGHWRIHLKNKALFSSTTFMKQWPLSIRTRVESIWLFIQRGERLEHRRRK